MKLLNFENWFSGEMSKSAKSPNLLTLKVNFVYQKLSESFSFFFSLTLLLKWCSIFESSPLNQFSKFNNFLWVCWFLSKNLSNFVSPDLKIHNRYCHKWLGPDKVWSFIIDLPALIPFVFVDYTFSIVAATIAFTFAHWSAEKTLATITRAGSVMLSGGPVTTNSAGIVPIGICGLVLHVFTLHEY